MRLVLRLVLIVAVLLAGLGLWKREEITRLLAVNSLFDEDRIVQNFSSMDRMFLSRPMSKGAGPVSPLPHGAAFTLPEGAAEWIASRSVTGLVVLKDGALRHESYYHGTGGDDLRISWSVAKSFLSALFGTVLADGSIASLDDPVMRYVPTLAGSAYDGAIIRDVLTMSSGAAFNEDYGDFNSDINRMGRAVALGGSLDAFARGMTARAAEAGTQWHYVSIDTHVVGMVIRGATGADLPTLMEERIIQPLGLEADPYYIVDGAGDAFVLGGLNLRTRDFARFGQMIAQGGAWQGRQVVPADWIAASTTPQAPAGVAYGFQWWIPADAEPGEVMAQGIYGQYIYINPLRGVVIAVNAADRDFEADGVDSENIGMFRRIAAAL